MSGHSVYCRINAATGAFRLPVDALVPHVSSFAVLLQAASLPGRDGPFFCCLAIGLPRTTVSRRRNRLSIMDDDLPSRWRLIVIQCVRRPQDGGLSSCVRQHASANVRASDFVSPSKCFFIKCPADSVDCSRIRRSRPCRHQWTFGFVSFSLVVSVSWLAMN